MGFGSTPQVQQSTANPAEDVVGAESLRIEELRRQEAVRLEREQTDLADFNTRLEAATGQARQSAGNFFTSQGLDPANFETDISNELTRRQGFIPSLDPTPGLSFEGTGQTVFDRLTSALQQRTLKSINQITPAGFAIDRIGSDFANPFISELINEQRLGADQISQNLFDRGVITATGFDAANREIGRQATSARPQLDQLASGLIETGRDDLRNIANLGRQRALQSTLGGTQFDPTVFQGRLDTSFGDFSAGLRDDIFAQAPPDLFNVAGITNVAGFAQGAQNTNFNPLALAGIIQNPEDEDEDENTSVGIF